MGGLTNKIFLLSLTDTEKLGKAISEELKPSDIVVFYGQVGAGKTTLIKSIVSHLEYPKEQVTSPTFSYLNIYQATIPVYHFDLYRFKSETDFLQRGFDEYFDKEGICLIEWAENIPSLIPENAKKITLEHHKEGRICLID